MTDERRVDGRHDGIENDKVKEKRDGKLLRRDLKHKVREELRGLRKARAAKTGVANPPRHGVTEGLECTRPTLTREGGLVGGGRTRTAGTAGNLGADKL